MKSKISRCAGKNRTSPSPRGKWTGKVGPTLPIPALKPRKGRGEHDIGTVATDGKIS